MYGRKCVLFVDEYAIVGANSMNASDAIPLVFKHSSMIAMAWIIFCRCDSRLTRRKWNFVEKGKSPVSRGFLWQRPLKTSNELGGENLEYYVGSFVLRCIGELSAVFNKLQRKIRKLRYVFPYLHNLSSFIAVDVCDSDVDGLVFWVGTWLVVWLGFGW